jgi:hypothetical protein
MTTTASPPPTHVDLAPPTTAARKVAAGAAALFGFALFMTVASIDVPKRATDTGLVHWWQQSDNRMSGIVSGLSAISAAVLIAVVMNYLGRLRATERAPQWMSFARSMGTAVTAVWLVTGAARATISRLVDVIDEPLPGVDVLRFATALNYALLGLAGMGVLGLTILAVSVVVLRTDALGRWVGYVGIGCSVVVLAATVAQYGAYVMLAAIAWAFCLAAAIWRAPQD